MASRQVEQLAEQHRRQQVALRAAASRDVVAVTRDLFDTADADRTWPALRSMLAAMVRQQNTVSAALADGYYRQAREQADPGGVFTPSTPVDLAEALLQAVLDSTGLAAFKRAIGLGRTPEEALRVAAVSLSGAISRLILNGGRDAILGNIGRDDQAVGWARITDKDPCAWCSMLAGRGPVYRSKEKAGFPAHDHCSCMPAVAFSRDEAWLQNSRDLYERWQKVTEGRSGDDARREWRRYWDNRNQPRSA